VTPLRALTRDAAPRIDGLCFDLDDTVLTHGQLTVHALSALWKLRQAGIFLLAVTGRPAAWGEFAVHQWPIDGAVAENGAVSFHRVGARVVCRDTCEPGERARRKQQLLRLEEELGRCVPSLKPTGDAHLRVSDRTWDVGEYEAPAESEVERAIHLLRSEGARISRSSIHLHASFDDVDKASGVLRFLADRGMDPSAALHRYVFVGDSGNDAACFAAFRLTVGVANVRRHLRHLTVPPRYVTDALMGGGFAELAEHLLSMGESEAPP
jgi:HAD superfamily hydrolase (TIGR01484 family)